MVDSFLDFLGSMGWITLSVSGYFLMALVSVFDKYLLHSRISKPAVYAFYVAIFSIFALLFIPLTYLLPKIGSFYFPGFGVVALSFLSGLFFIYGLVALYRAVQENEVSRVVPLVGSMIPIFSVVFSKFFLGESFSVFEIMAMAILVLGGFLISFDFPIKDWKLFEGFKYSVVSALFQSISFVLMKKVFESAPQDFINGFIWNRAGFFLAGLSLFLYPPFKSHILSSFKIAKKSRRKTISTGYLFVLNKIMAAMGSFLVARAIFMGSAPSVNSVGSIQFVFVLVIVGLLSIRHAEIFQEKLSFGAISQKIFAIIMIIFGIWMLSLGSREAFFLPS